MDSETVLAATPSTPTLGTKKNNAPRCHLEGCTDRAVKTIGDCRHWYFFSFIPFVS